MDVENDSAHMDQKQISLWFPAIPSAIHRHGRHVTEIRKKCFQPKLVKAGTCWKPRAADALKMFEAG